MAKFHSEYMEPSDFGLKANASVAIGGGNAQENAALTKSVLNGDSGPYRDVVLLNAAAALVAADRAKTLMEGMALSTFSIDSGAALNKLDELDQIR